MRTRDVLLGQANLVTGGMSGAIGGITSTDQLMTVQAVPLVYNANRTVGRVPDGPRSWEGGHDESTLISHSARSRLCDRQ
jgi:hypothetical protein